RGRPGEGFIENRQCVPAARVKGKAFRSVSPMCNSCPRGASFGGVMDSWGRSRIPKALQSRRYSGYWARTWVGGTNRVDVGWGHSTSVPLRWGYTGAHPSADNVPG